MFRPAQHLVETRLRSEWEKGAESESPFGEFEVKRKLDLVLELKILVVRNDMSKRQHKNFFLFISYLSIGLWRMEEDWTIIFTNFFALLDVLDRLHDHRVLHVVSVEQKRSRSKESFHYLILESDSNFS